MQNTITEVIQRRFDEFNFPLVINRSIIPHDNSTLFICSGMQQEKELREKIIKLCKRKWKKFHNKSPEWWWDTFGILPEELVFLQ